MLAVHCIFFYDDGYVRVDRSAIFAGLQFTAAARVQTKRWKATPFHRSFIVEMRKIVTSIANGSQRYVNELPMPQQ